MAEKSKRIQRTSQGAILLGLLLVVVSAAILDAHATAQNVVMNIGLGLLAVGAGGWTLAAKGKKK